MNLAPLLDAAASLLSLTLIGAVPILLPAALKLLHVNIDAAHEASLENTISSAIGKAIQYGTAAGDPLLANVTIKNSALNAAAAFAMDDAPVQVAALGYTKQSIAEVIDARLAKALAAKPTVVAAPDTPPTAEAVKTAAMLERAAVPAVVSEPTPALAPA
jgi:hypothetical protein